MLATLARLTLGLGNAPNKHSPLDVTCLFGPCDNHTQPSSKVTSLGEQNCAQQTPRLKTRKVGSSERTKHSQSLRTPHAL